MKTLQSYPANGKVIVLNNFIVNEKHKLTLMKNFTQNVKIILNFFPYLLKKIYFKQ